MKDSTRLPTVYIDEPAADALMKAMASASPADVAAALKSPLQIRPTFHALSVASSLNEGGEAYDITVCTVPANTIKPLHAAVGEADLENARRDSRNFQDGGVEVAGFEGNTGIQRFAVCISQALRIWLADPAIPEPVLSKENEIVFITGENPELKVVSGEERPPLEFMKYSMETGKPESCSLALYDTSPAGLETFSAENAEIFYMSKTVRDRQTGEERTVPVFGAEAEADGTEENEGADCTHADNEADGTDGMKVLAVLRPEQIEALLAKKTEKPEPEQVTFEALTRATAAGDAAAMKRLGKMYETGDGTEQDNKKALELYKKAQTLLPDDKDFEFDIFMLEMMM